MNFHSKIFFVFVILNLALFPGQYFWSIFIKVHMQVIQELRYL